MDLTFFNPHSQTEADFLASFVARGKESAYFLQQLRLARPAHPARHHLIVAPRGYGKTSLLRRIAIAVRAEEGLAQHFIALTFREEQHNVISLDVFWRNCLQSLLEAREDEQASDAEIQQLDAAWTEHAPRQTLKRDDQDGEPAWHEFHTRCELLGRRPLLLIDNLDSLLAGLGAKLQWSLREVLQRDDGPMLIAAAARFPDSTHDPAAAFYDFFRIETLDKLNDQEVMGCLRTLAMRRGEAGSAVLALLGKDPGRVAALNTLAGGNPRTLSVLYSVLESHLSADVLSQLSAMLDTFTSWYQSRTNDLPLQARAVFDALALHWDPMPAAAVGAVTGLDTTAVSSQISRLEKAGLVEAVALNRRGKGRNGYQLSERFFNIWYLMRNGPRRARQSIKFLAVFLQSCFSPAERRTLALTVLTGESANPCYALGLAASLRTSPLRERLLDYAETQSNATGTLEEYGAAIEEMRSRDHRRHRSRQPGGSEGPDRDLATLNDAIGGLGQASEPGEREEVARALVSKGVTMGRHEQAIEIYDSVVTRFGDAPEPGLRHQVARALVNKGIRMGRLGRHQQEIEVYDTMVTRFGDASEPGLREQVARVLVNKGITLGQLGRNEQEIEAYDSVVTRFGDASEPGLREQVAGALVSKGIALGQLGRDEQEIEAYESVVTRFGDASEPNLREQVARALVSKGITLSRLGRDEQEIETYDSVVTRFGDAAEPGLREQVARALVNKGITLGQLGRNEQEIEAYDSVVTRFGDASEPALRQAVARALVNKGITLGQLGRNEQETEAYDSVVSRFGEASEPGLRQQVAMALVNKGVVLGQLGRNEQAIEAYDSVVSRFGDASEPGLREQVARALVNRGITLDQLGRHEEAIEAYDSVVSRFGAASEPGLRQQVAMALVNKGVVMVQLGRHKQAIEVHDSVVTHFGDTSEPGLQEAVARALVTKGIALGDLGSDEQAIGAYDSVVTRFGDASEPVLGEQVAKALVNKGITLERLGRHEEAIGAYDSVVTRFGDASEPQLREPVARALDNKGVALGQLGRHEEAIGAYDSVVTRFGDDSEPGPRAQVALALVNKGVAQGQLGRHEQEIEAYDGVVSRFGDASEPALRQQVALALVKKGEVLGQSGRTDEAEATLRKAAFGGTDLVRGEAWNSLGNLLLDRSGNPVAALAAYELGLATDHDPSHQAMLHTNCAFALALHGGDISRARDHVRNALLDQESLSPAGRCLMIALSYIREPHATQWPRVFEQIGLAVEGTDANVWSTYFNNLQRLLWFVLAQGEGAALLRWMDQNQYPLRYAPLYHAVVAAIGGKDTLLRINPETRQAAARIYEGIAQRLELYANGDRTMSTTARKKPSRRP